MVSRATTLDVVFLTHLHIDHVGWNTALDGVPTLPARALRRASGMRSPSCELAGHAPARATLHPAPLADGFEAGLGRRGARSRGDGVFEAPATTPGDMAVRIEADGRAALLIAECRRAPGAPAGAGLGLRLRHRRLPSARKPRHALLPETRRPRRARRMRALPGRRNRAHSSPERNRRLEAVVRRPLILVGLCLVAASCGGAENEPNLGRRRSDGGAGHRPVRGVRHPAIERPLGARLLHGRGGLRGEERSRRLRVRRLRRARRDRGRQRSSTCAGCSSPGRARNGSSSKGESTTTHRSPACRRRNCCGCSAARAARRSASARRTSGARARFGTRSSWIARRQARVLVDDLCRGLGRRRRRRAPHRLEDDDGTATFEFFDFGADVRIEAPPASDVVEGDLVAGDSSSSGGGTSGGIEVTCAEEPAVPISQRRRSRGYGATASRCRQRVLHRRQRRLCRRDPATRASSAAMWMPSHARVLR